MNTSSHDFVTVDMRGFKAALVATAASRLAGKRWLPALLRRPQG